MNELVAFLLGFLTGAILMGHVFRRYHRKDGTYGDLVRRLLG